MRRSLAVDLGGTHIRFRRLGDDADPASVHVVATGGVGSFEEAFEQWRERCGARERLDVIAIAAAGPVTGDRARVTNIGWTLDARAIARACNARRCLLVNDVAAIAWALPSLDGNGLHGLTTGDSHLDSTDGGLGSGGSGSGGSGPGGLASGDSGSGGSGSGELGSGGSGSGGSGSSGSGSVSPMVGDPNGSDDRAADEMHVSSAPGPCERAARAVIAPGTGLGVSGLLPTATGGFAAVEGEGGHRTLAAQGPREWAIVNALAERFGHASAERALSGPGIEAIRAAIASVDGVRDHRDRTAAEIAHDAFTGADPVAEEAIAAFTGFLGSVAGDLALTLGARGGVYIAGGIVPGWGERFDAARFLDRFRAKGRFRAWLSEVPVHVVTHPYPALAGLEHLLALRSAGGPETGRDAQGGSPEDSP